MLIDLAREQPDFSARTFDVCIAGAGVAGIVLARALASSGRQVLLLEAGGLEVSDASQALYRGENAGVENLHLDATRIRALGGSSNHWGGWCIPRDPFDFQRTDLAADGAWPITARDLEPFFDAAMKLLKVTQASGSVLELAESQGNLKTIRVYFSAPPANFKKEYLADLTAAKTVTLVVNAPVTGITFDAAGGVESFAVRAPGLTAPQPFRGRRFVLALGAVENIRALLLAKRRYGNLLAEGGDWLGRGYMQHLHQLLGHFLLADETTAPAASAESGRTQIFLSSTEKFLAASQTGAFRLYTQAMSCEGLYDEFRRLVGASCSAVASGGALLVTAEQMPNRDSRISLTAEPDALGLPRVKMDWRIGEADRRTLRAAALEFGRYLIRAKLGRLKVNPAVFEGEQPLEGWVKLGGAAGAAGHQMGGTRMSRAAVDGIVDPDCRLWGTPNLYVAGSSVFRTGGNATPTLTIVQLALRLADALNRNVAGP